MAGKYIERKDKPPKVGPLATRRWDDQRQRWDIRLTPEGQRVVEDHLRKYPEPAKALAAFDPATFRWLYYKDWEEANNAAKYALVKAAVTFDPDRGATFLTWANWWVRSYCQRLLEKRAGEPAEFVRGDARQNIAPQDDYHAGCMWDCLPAADEEGLSQLELDELAAVLRQAVRDGGLTDLERRQVAAIYGDGLSTSEVADSGRGSSRQAVHHNVHNGIRKLRERAAPMLKRCGYP